MNADAYMHEEEEEDEVDAAAGADETLGFCLLTRPHLISCLKGKGVRVLQRTGSTQAFVFFAADVAIRLRRLNHRDLRAGLSRQDLE